MTTYSQTFNNVTPDRYDQICDALADQYHMPISKLESKGEAEKDGIKIIWSYDIELYTLLLSITSKYPVWIVDHVVNNTLEKIVGVKK